MKFFIIITKNTASLDYILPVVHKLLEHQHEINILCLTNTSLYVKSYMRNLNLPVLDRVNIIGLDNLYFSPLNKLLPLLMKFMVNSPSLSEIKILLRTNLIDGLMKLILKVCAKLILFIIPKINLRLLQNSDGVIYDLRHDRNPLVGDKILYYLERHQIPVFFAQHAPHMRTPSGEFKGLTLRKFPKLIVHRLISFKPTTRPANIPLNETYHLVGCPALDESWLKKSFFTTNEKRQYVPKIVYIGRRFTEEGANKVPQIDPYILSYQEVTERFKQIQILSERLKLPVFIKPHPNTNYSALSKLMSRHECFHLIHGPINNVLTKEDLVISEPSTLLLTFELLGLPTYLIQDRLQESIEKNWDALANLYEFVSKVEVDKISEISLNFDKNKQSRKKIRENYSSNSTEKIVNTLMKHCK